MGRTVDVVSRGRTRGERARGERARRPRGAPRSEGRGSPNERKALEASTSNEPHLSRTDLSTLEKKGCGALDSWIRGSEGATREPITDLDSLPSRSPARDSARTTPSGLRTASPFSRRAEPHASTFGSKMGFANIWATKAECNGKGQRRWCVPPAPPAGRPCAEPAFFSDDGRLRPIAPLRHASAPARDSGRDRIRGTDSPRRARLSGGWDAARRRGSAQRGRMRSLGFHPCITSTCERHHP